MDMPYWLLKLLPVWDYVCPKCKRDVEQKSHECPYCGENYGVPLRVPPKVLKDAKALEEYVHKHIFPKVSASQRDYLTRFFTTIFAHGFEGGDFGTDPQTGYAWTGTAVGSGATATVESANPHHGTYDMKNYVPAGEYSVAYKSGLTSTNPCYGRFYVKFDNVPVTVGNSLNLGNLQAEPIEIVSTRVKRYSDGLKWTLRYRSGGAWVESDTIVSATPAINTNQWYCIEYKAYVHTSAGEARVYVDGTEILTATGLNNDAVGGITRIEVGISADEASTAYHDCVVVADTYIGPEVPPKPKGSIVVHAKLAGVI
jgi:DNA-directed RNA polymerase subunit RPC12/RpoP